MINMDLYPLEETINLRSEGWCCSLNMKCCVPKKTLAPHLEELFCKVVESLGVRPD